MSVAEEKFSAIFDETASAIKHRGAYYLEDASEKVPSPFAVFTTTA